MTAGEMTDASPFVIDIRDATKTYGMGDIQVHALRGVSLQVERGDYVAIMGASGSGKSTLMNIIGCLDAPTKGEYFLDGADVNALGDSALADIRNRGIGFVFQSFNLIPRTSALENVELPLFYAEVAQAEQRARAREALAAVGLSGREGHLPNQLSGGQQQRVAIARALVNRPSVLLADEPTGDLDEQTAETLHHLLRSIHRERRLIDAIIPAAIAGLGRAQVGEPVLGRSGRPVHLPQGLDRDRGVVDRACSLS